MTTPLPVIAQSHLETDLNSKALGTGAHSVSFDAQQTKLTGVIVIAILGVIYSLYFGRAIILPVVMAAVLNMLLQPLMGVLHNSLRLPMPVAAILLIIGVFAIISGIAYAISVPASGWTTQISTTFDILKERLAFLSRPISAAEAMLQNIQNMGNDAKITASVPPPSQGNTLPGIIFFNTASTLAEFFTTIIILFFMLVSGDRLMRGLIQVLPSFADKRRAVEISNEIQSGITRYLLTITLMNTAVGIAAGCAMWLIGLTNPILWGIVAFCLNFIPILGPMIGIAIFFAAGLISLAWPFPALGPVLLYGLIHLVEGETVTPLLLSRHLELNPVLVILSLFFWHAIWGIPGAFLAVPLLAIFKILADRVEPLKSIGHLISA